MSFAAVEMANKGYQEIKYGRPLASDTVYRIYSNAIEIRSEQALFHQHT
jgi:hypothetical protein